jgi:aspartate/methionine/tyrosine aminotransferase
MDLPPFLLDHWLAQHEFASPPIRYNLASSAGPRWTHGDLLELDDGTLRDQLRAMPVLYAPPEGTRALREQVARLHKVDPEWVLITTGASEALSIVLCLTAEPGASVALPSPGYPATDVFAKAWGLKLQFYPISRENGYAVDAASVLRSVDGSTRLVVVNSPHNPTGAVMRHTEMRRLAQELRNRGIPLVADEVFHHVYFGEAQASAAGLENCIQIGDFSKSLSLSGLRLGWIIEADDTRLKRIVDARSYFTISTAPLMEAFGVTALRSPALLIDRLNSVTRANLAQLERFIAQHPDHIGWVKPQGGTLAFAWLQDESDARPLCEAFAKAGVLVAPGDCYGMPSYIRIGFGACEPVDFEAALGIMTKVMKARAAPRA